MAVRPEAGNMGLSRALRLASWWAAQQSLDLLMLGSSIKLRPWAAGRADHPALTPTQLVPSFRATFVRIPRPRLIRGSRRHAPVRSEASAPPPPQTSTGTMDAMPRVAVVTTLGCPYCKKAKAALRNAGVPFEELELSEQLEVLTRIKQLTGQATVPQVWLRLPAGTQAVCKAASSWRQIDLLHVYQRAWQPASLSPGSILRCFQPGRAAPPLPRTQIRGNTPHPPQVFVGGKLIGGASELLPQLADGSLQQQLAALRVADPLPPAIRQTLKESGATAQVGGALALQWGHTQHACMDCLGSRSGSLLAQQRVQLRMPQSKDTQGEGNWLRNSFLRLWNSIKGGPGDSRRLHHDPWQRRQKAHSDFLLVQAAGAGSGSGAGSEEQELADKMLKAGPSR